MRYGPMFLNSAEKQSGFTLVEIIIVIVVIGVLSTVAVPKYQDLALQSKSNACKASLMAFREGINLWRVNGIIKTGVAAWPAIDTLRTVDLVMSHQIPPNPFQNKANAPDSIVTGVTKGVVVGTRGGWAYKASTGEIWANTNTTTAVAGCGTSVAVGENSW
jgi:prepilin-type N-terminal cleavage/methylation domain-containing protein